MLLLHYHASHSPLIMPKAISAAQLTSVLAKLDAGMRHADIAAQTGVSAGQISKLHNIHCPNLPCNPAGRPVKVTPAAAGHLVRLAANGNSHTCVSAAQQYQAVTGESLSCETV